LQEPACLSVCFFEVEKSIEFKMTGGCFLETLSWPEAEEKLKTAKVIVIGMGARCKEHALHLQLNNDYVMADYFTKRIVEQCENVVAAPTIPFGFYPAFVNYPGSIHIRRDICTATVVDMCRSLHRHSNAARFYIQNTGVSTNWALEPARAQLADEGIVMEYTDLLKAAVDDIKAVEEQSFGTHADEIETSMMLYIAPETVRMERAVPDCGTQRSPGPFTRDPAATSGIYSPSGAWGDPTLGTLEKGERVVEALVRYHVDIIAQLEDPAFIPSPLNPVYMGERSYS
jgi:creatinine amidohydrolase